MLAEEKKGNAWTTFVKDWATARGVPYMVAIKDPDIKQAYKDSKKTKKKLVIVDNFTKLMDDAVAMAEAIDPPAEKKKAGRPSKYATDEERKEAKRLKTLASNKKKREEMSKKRKAGTMTEVEKENWLHDTELNVIRTTNMRDGKRAEAIVAHETAFNKLKNYIEDNSAEFLEHIRDEKPTDLFGDNRYLTARRIAEKALSSPEQESLFKTHIPNFSSLYYYTDDALKPLIDKIQRSVWDLERVNQERANREKRGMMADDPFEKRKEKERIAEEKAAEEAKEKRRQEQRVEADKVEKARRAALTPAEREMEDIRLRQMMARFQSSWWGSGRGKGKGKGKSGGRWVSLTDNKTCWD